MVENCDQKKTESDDNRNGAKPKSDSIGHGGKELHGKQALHVVRKTMHHHNNQDLQPLALHDDGKGHKVYDIKKDGESLSAIAQRELGTHATTTQIDDLVDVLYKANKGSPFVKSKNVILKGGTLIVPDLEIRNNDPACTENEQLNAQKAALSNTEATSQVVPRVPAVQAGETAVRDPVDRGTVRLVTRPLSQETPIAPAAVLPPTDSKMAPVVKESPVPIKTVADRGEVVAPPVVSTKPTLPAGTVQTDKIITGGHAPTREVAATPSSAVQGAPKTEREAVTPDQPKKTGVEDPSTARTPKVGPAKDDKKTSDALTADANAVKKAVADRDINTIDKILQGKSDAEREQLDTLYKGINTSGQSMEQDVRGFETGPRYSNTLAIEHFMNLRYSQDANKANQAARSLHEDLLENKIGGARSQDQIEKDVRNLLNTQNKSQIDAIDKEFQQLYHMSLRDAVMKDDRLTKPTLDMCGVYLDGNDKRTDKQTSQLIDTALHAQKLDLFQEAMRDATPQQRKAFLDNKGEDRINQAFGHFYSDSDARHALDYAQEGQLDAATIVRDNTHAFNNDKAIQQAITSMTPEKRKLYADGAALAAGQTPPDLKDADAATKCYNRLHDALEDASSETQVQRWEQLIKGMSDDSLVASIAKHEHVLGNDNTAAVAMDVRNMSAADWKYAHDHPEYRTDLQKMLTSLGESTNDVNKTLGLYDSMLKPNLTYEQAHDLAKAPILDQLKSCTNILFTNRQDFMRILPTMSKAEQEQYRNDKDFRQQVDDTLKVLERPQDKDAARRMLNQVLSGKAPDSDVIANLEAISNASGSHTGEVAKVVDKALKDDPTLSQRLVSNNPQDKEFQSQFKEAAQSAFGDDYDLFGKYYLEQGRLPLDKKTPLYDSGLSVDYDRMFSDLASATPAELADLKKNPGNMLASMDKEHQTIAQAVIDQGEMRPEDKIRLAKIGWGGTDDVVKTLQSIKKEDLQHSLDEYARKYGTSMIADVESKLGGADRDKAEAVFAQNTSLEKQVQIANVQTEKARSGFGAFVADSIYRSGTGAQADDAMNQTNHALAEDNKMQAAIAQGTDMVSHMTPQQLADTQAKMNGQLAAAISAQHQATDNHNDTKKAGAEYATDAGIAGVAIGSMIVTGGADTPLVVSLALAGGAIKVGGTAALEGNSYDWSTGNVIKDGAVGAVTGATSLLGPGEVAAVFGIGRTAATEGARLAAGEVGASLLRTGAQETLEKGSQDIVRDALASGAKKLDRKDFVVLADKVIAPEIIGTARQEAVDKLATSLEENVSANMAQGVVRNATQHFLNSTGGAAGGGAGGVVQGVSQWDSRKTVGDNLEQVAGTAGASALSGMLGGGVTSVGFSQAGRFLKGAFARAASREIGDFHPILPEQISLSTNEAGRVSSIETPLGLTSIKYHTEGKLDGAIKEAVLPDGTRFSTKDGENWKISTRAGDVDSKGQLTVDPDGTVNWRPEKTNHLTFKPDGTEIETDKATGNVITRAANGALMDVATRYGAKVNFEYDDHKLTKVTSSDGRVIERQDPSANGQERWLIKDAKHPENEGTVVEGTSQLRADGSLQIRSENGTGSVFKPDGSTLSLDDKGRITKIVDAQGRESNLSYDGNGMVQATLADGTKFERMPKFTRDQQGRLTKVERGDGSDLDFTYHPDAKSGEPIATVTDAERTYTTTDGKIWTTPGEKYKGFTFTFDDNGSSTISGPEGLRQLTTASGSQGYFKDRQLTAVYTTDGSRYQFKDGRWGFSSEAIPAKNDTLNPVNGTVTVENGQFMLVDAGGNQSVLPGQNTYEIARPDRQPIVGKVRVADDGTITHPTDVFSQSVNTDGSTHYLSSGGRVVEAIKHPTGRVELTNGSMPSDDFHLTMSSNMRNLDNAQWLQDGVVAVKNDLRTVNFTSTDGTTSNMLDRLTGDTNFTVQQKDNIMQNLAEVRQFMASFRDADAVHPGMEMNWRHTQEELGRVLDMARVNKLSPSETEDALLASMYSDAARFTSPPPLRAEPNMLTHHQDAAWIAETLLERANVPPERLARIVQAIKATQSAPPESIGYLYHEEVQNGLDSLLKSGKIDASQHDHMQKVLDGMSTELNGRTVIRDIAMPKDAPIVRNAQGQYEVKFTAEQRDLLRLSGIDDWRVPHDPSLEPGFGQLSIAEQARALSDFRVAQAVVDSDSIQSYASASGVAQTVAGHGPGTAFPNQTVWQSLDAADAGLRDAYSSLSPEGRKLADQTLAARNQMMQDESSGVRKQMDAWLESKGLDPAKDKIPYYNSELKYPETLNADEQARLADSASLGGKPLSEEERQQLLYKGLSPQEIRDYQLAQEIKQKMTDFLNAPARATDHLEASDGSAPSIFAPTKVRRIPDNPQAKVVPLVMPKEVGEPIKLANGDLETPTEHGTIVRSSDGSFKITDRENNSVRTYDSNHRLIQAEEQGKFTRTFGYGEDGKLTSIKFGPDDEIYTVDGREWVKKGAEDKPWFTGNVTVDADGTVRAHSFAEASVKVTHMDGNVEEYFDNGRINYLKADYATESNRLEQLARRNYPDQANYDRFQGFLREFETNAKDRHLDDNAKALFYKQLNRLLADDPNAVLSQQERSELATQILNHAAKPNTVDQGANSTCNVTTVEVRNYVKRPDKNAQNIADIALTGTFTTRSGSVIDMQALQFGIKPDAWAEANLRLQRAGTEVKQDGTRDWASQINQLALVNTHYQSEAKMILGGNRLVHDSDLAYDRNGDMIGVFDSHVGDPKDRTQFTTLFDGEGNKVNDKPGIRGEPLYTRFSRKPVDLDRVLWGENGRVLGLQSDVNIEHLYGAAGGPVRLNDIKPGVQLYDDHGNVAFRMTRPNDGEIVYDKTRPEGSTGEDEGLFVKDNGVWKPLQRLNGKNYDTPHLYSNQLDGISREFNASNDNYFVIDGFYLESPKNLAARIQALEKEDGLPAVIHVNTSHKPFSDSPTLDVLLDRGGSHVVNIWGYNPGTNRVFITNQWGSKYDNLEDGIPLDQLWRATKDPISKRFFEAPRFYRYLGYAAGGTVAAGTVAGAGVGAYYWWRHKTGQPTPPVSYEPRYQNFTPRPGQSVLEIPTDNETNQ